MFGSGMPHSIQEGVVVHVRPPRRRECSHNKVNSSTFAITAGSCEACVTIFEDWQKFDVNKNGNGKFDVAL